MQNDLSDLLCQSEVKFVCRIASFHDARGGAKSISFTTLMEGEMHVRSAVWKRILCDYITRGSEF